MTTIFLRVKQNIKQVKIPIENICFEEVCFCKLQRAVLITFQYQNAVFQLD